MDLAWSRNPAFLIVVVSSSQHGCVSVKDQYLNMVYPFQNLH